MLPITEFVIVYIAPPWEDVFAASAVLLINCVFSIL